MAEVIRRLCIVGGGAELATLLIDYWLGHRGPVTAISRSGKLAQPFESFPEGLRIIEDVDSPDSQYDSFDVVVTMTGSTRDIKLAEMHPGKWEQVVYDTLTVPALTLAKLIPRINTYGNIVVVGSIVGSTGGYGCCNYAAAKAGLGGLARGLANELAEKEICVNLLELGFIDAGMGKRLSPSVRTSVEKSIPLRRFGCEEDFVKAVAYLADVRYMTGNTLTLAGGLR